MRLLVLLCVLAAPHSTPGQGLAPPTAVTLANHRNGPDSLGYYDFQYLTSDGSYRQESGSPLPDQGYSVSGAYSYTSPEGVLVEAKYAADELGYRVQHSQGSLPPAPPHAIRQIQLAKEAFRRKGEIYTNAYSSPGDDDVLPHPAHLTQAFLPDGSVHLSAHRAYLTNKRLAILNRQKEQKRLELARKAANDRRQAFVDAEQRRLAEVRRRQEERKAIQEAEKNRRITAQEELQERLNEQERLQEEREEENRRFREQQNRLTATRLRLEQERRRQRLLQRHQIRRTPAAQRLDNARLQELERRLIQQGGASSLRQN